MEDHNAILLGKLNQPGIKLIRRGHPQRVGWIGNHHKPRFFRQSRIKILQIRQIIIPLIQRVADAPGPTQEGTQLKNRITRIGDQYHIPGIAQRPADVGQSLLGAIYRHQLILG